LPWLVYPSRQCRLDYFGTLRSSRIIDSAQQVRLVRSFAKQSDTVAVENRDTRFRVSIGEGIVPGACSETDKVQSWI